MKTFLLLVAFAVAMAFVPAAAAALALPDATPTMIEVVAVFIAVILPMAGVWLLVMAITNTVVLVCRGYRKCVNSLRRPRSNNERCNE